MKHSVPVLIAIALNLCGIAQGHSFDVRDSIEMATFSEPSQFDPLSRPIYSPDSKQFCVVTTRGLIAADMAESTLRVFDVEAVRSFLKSAARIAPTPTIVASMSASPAIRSNVPYAPIISEPRWSRDSRSLFFLAQGANAQRRLYVATLSSAHPHPVTPAGRDVFAYDVAAGAIAYLYTDIAAAAAEDERRRLAGVVLNEDARSVAGSTLGDILLPEQSNGHWFVKDRLAVIRKGAATEVRLQGKAAQPLHLLEGNGAAILALSPQGEQLVELLPEPDIPQSWQSYRPALERLKLHPGRAASASRANENTPRFYALIDLSTGSVTPMTGPQGQSLGYPHRAAAIWSGDGQKLLLTSAFLPKSSADSDDLCVAIVVDRRSGETECVTRDNASSGTDDQQNSLGVLIEAAFAGDDVQLGFQYYGQFTLQTYRRDPTGWHQVDSAVVAADHEISQTATAGIAITVRQTLNDHPVLAATDTLEQRSRLLWDPNPQLRNMALGQASVYHWKDANGYQWSAGLLKPVGYVPGQRYPLVIQTHGFLDGQFVTDGSYPSAMAARPLASAGFVVLQMNSRHTHTGTLEETTDQLAGFKAAIGQLAANGLIDPQRVGIVGFSRTAWYAESALISDPALFAAATIADGIDGSYLGRVLFGEAANSYDAFYGGKPVGDSLRGWFEHAPDFHRDAIRTPIRLEAHSRGSILGEWGIYAALSLQGKPVDFIYIPDGQHILQRPLERMASQQGNVDWLRFWLQGFEDPDSNRTGQAGRWEKLCDAQISGNPGRPTFCVPSSH